MIRQTYEYMQLVMPRQSPNALSWRLPLFSAEIADLIIEGGMPKRSAGMKDAFWSIFGMPALRLGMPPDLSGIHRDRDGAEELH